MGGIVDLTVHDLPVLRAFGDRWIRPKYVVLSDPFFSWQFLDPIDASHPLEPAALGYYDDDRLTAMVLARRHQFWIGGQTVEGTWLHEWFADDTAPGSGMAPLRRLLKHSSFLGSAGLSMIAQSVIARLQPICRFDLCRLFAVIDPTATQDLLIRNGPEVKGMLTLRTIGRPAATTRMIEPSGFGEPYEQVWAEFRRSVHLATDRTEAFMTWRYLRHPIFTYQIRMTESAHGAAWFVWREEPVEGRSKPVARLCEAIGSAAALTEGFRALAIEMGRREIAFVDFFCSHMDTVASLLKAGMRHVPVEQGFDLPRLLSPLADDIRKTISVTCTLPPGSDPDLLYGHHRAYITKGDVNQDRPNFPASDY